MALILYWMCHHNVCNRCMYSHYNTYFLLQVKAWKKTHYHSLTLGGLKETKTCNDEFAKAQKPWAKLYKKVMDSKKLYYQSCKEERSAQMQVYHVLCLAFRMMTFDWCEWEMLIIPLLQTGYCVMKKLIILLNPDKYLKKLQIWTTRDVYC